MKKVTQLFLICSLLLISVTVQINAQTDSIPTNELSTEPVIEWMHTLYRLIEAEGINPPNAARFLAYAGITTYESLLGGMVGNNSLAGQIWTMPDLPFPNENLTYDWLTVHNVAFSTMLSNLFINADPSTYETIEAHREASLLARTEVVGEDIVENSMVYGDALAKTLLQWVREDGYLQTRDMVYEIPIYEGAWEVTTEGAEPVEPFWWQIRTFILDEPYQCAVWMDVLYSTDENSTFYQQALEVIDAGRNLTAEQREIALYWVDTPGITGTPAGHWWSIANQMVEQLELPLGRAAELYAMLGIGMGDAFISAWAIKYNSNLLRPVTYIRDNIRASWSPFIESPSFPEYPSGHSVVSGAAWVVLSEMLGPMAFTDQTHIIYEHQPVERTFYSFEQAAEEAAISRLYGGIHYRSAIENGVRQGECVGEWAMDTIRLNPVFQGE